MIKHPAVGEKLLVNNVQYLKTVFIAEYFFDIGIYWPKLSITTFYWFLIPEIFQTLRKGLFASTVYLVSCLIAAILIVTLISNPISNNWSIEHQLESAWNSYTLFVVQWCLNFSTDLLLFIFPFFLLPHLKLRREQKFGLVGVFSLGGITLTVSLARFIAYNVTDFGLDDASGNTLCTAEMSTAVIVVCLPGLKKFIMRSKTPTHSADRAEASQSESGQHSSNHVFKSRSTPQAYAEWGVREDEIELVTVVNKSDRHSIETPNDRDATDKPVPSVSMTAKVECAHSGLPGYEWTSDMTPQFVNEEGFAFGIPVTHIQYAASWKLLHRERALSVVFPGKFLVVSDQLHLTAHAEEVLGCFIEGNDRDTQHRGHGHEPPPNVKGDAAPTSVEPSEIFGVSAGPLT
ncbi:hypothetical protein AK830_g6987 [Neonectria ditissima]|uniref:Rhodopsin domain-containing protein n=1 Tax=Neonectria ditissima TaxID=78410 RepID=A0A0P7BH65_9HYPO|nr:hypothetical protein AK830_g6987 [Neonectria ditissima]